ncbi:nodulation protein NodN [Burkholderia cepacia]|uniref:MaoC family dehydratase n=1 Tax=Burkholderia cepacia TaxID=292 RepID=UPI00075B1FEA|nr:MaoC family dehydratase [Burkholderia cepacia]KWF82517.1 nodulation protein NodN [Burkholderia cepacia]UQO37842.1 MaoC family dehydratase [Burkholderia cepacia]UQO52180.1 MaoC family dehydratase [Burkholderia cepacia]UQP06327.1 MaoC family dehydratase [Burkholderia cepacia]
MRDTSSTTSGNSHGHDNSNVNTHVAAQHEHASLSRSQLSSLVGGELGVSEWFCIDQASIDAFAEVTRDWQPIHVDEEAARASPFGGTIAHGFLTLSLLSAMAFGVIPAIEGQRAAVNYGMNNLRFVTPVRSGGRVRGRFVLKEVRERSSDSFQLIIGVTVEIENQPKPALVAEWLTLINT